MANGPNILFTAFEPSGDALAGSMIVELAKACPHVKIWALGGHKMRQAGATLLGNTTEQAVMLTGAVSQVWTHRQRLKRLKQWLADHEIAALVPVDSPAANWSICGLVRRCQPQAKIVHLVAPQLWAWAPWRIRKLRRLTDHVLCTLPFEPRWLGQRGVNATFVGHRVFNSDWSKGSTGHSDLAQRGSPTIALLPGSRVKEIQTNWPTMLNAFVQLRQQHPKLRGLVAVTNDQAAQLVRSAIGHTPALQGCPESLDIKTQYTDEVLARADVVLVVSGTATLQVAAHRKPMVVLYNVNWWTWQMLGRWLVKTRTFSLPNLIAQANGARQVVQEFVPHFGAVKPVAHALDELLGSPDKRQQQMQAYNQIAQQFAGRRFDQTAAQALIQIARLSGQLGP